MFGMDMLRCSDSTQLRPPAQQTQVMNQMRDLPADSLPVCSKLKSLLYAQSSSPLRRNFTPDRSLCYNPHRFARAQP